MNKIWEYYVNLSPSIKGTIILTIILLILLIIINFKLRNHSATKTPTGIILVIEWLVDSINNFTKGMMGKYWKLYAPYFLFLAIFIFTANISGLIGLTPPTSSLSVTLTLGFVTFFIIQYTGIKTRGMIAYLKDFVSPYPFLLPLNIISTVVVPFSLGFRLFGNIMSGAIILSLFYLFLDWIAVIVTPPLHAIFDIAFGLIQTFVFMMISAMFISGQLPEEA